MDAPKMEIDINELYQIIGELEVIRRKQHQLILILAEKSKESEKEG